VAEEHARQGRAALEPDLMETTFTPGAGLLGGLRIGLGSGCTCGYGVCGMAPENLARGSVEIGLFVAARVLGVVGYRFFARERRTAVAEPTS
jgi:hypothetical protein